MLILDTNHVEVLRYDGELKARLVQRLANAQGQTLAITVITLQENLQGWLDKVRDSRLSVLNQVPYYEKLLDVLDFYNSNIELLPFDNSAAIKYNELRASGVSKTQVKDHDLKIGAIALCNNATLLTRDIQDFQKIPGIDAQDWLLDIPEIGINS